MTQVLSHADLNALYDTPHPVAVSKEIQHIEVHTQRFIEHSPFMVMATTDTTGLNDVSPRGGEPGFVKVLDKYTLAFADMQGNNRIDSLRNLIDNPAIGLMFMIPGIGEVVRVQGKASLHTDDALKAQFNDGKKTPKLVVKVKVETTLFHCPRAIAFAKLWKADNQIERSFLPSLLSIIEDQIAEGANKKT